MKRTQLYIPDEMWSLLHGHAKKTKTTISDLVRQAVNQCYGGVSEQRRKAMQDFVGIRENEGTPFDASAYVRSLRKSDRLEKLNMQRLHKG